jgi:hypothetical protein
MLEASLRAIRAQRSHAFTILELASDPRASPAHLPAHLPALLLDIMRQQHAHPDDVQRIGHAMRPRRTDTQTT